MWAASVPPSPLHVIARHALSFSRHDLPEVLHFVVPLKIRGRREDRVRAAPAVSRAMCIKECCTRAYWFSGEHPAFPAQWLYGLYVIVLLTGFLATIIIGSFRFRQLDTSTGASDPNDFTVRNSPFVSRAVASTAPCPSFATTADAPGGTGWTEGRQQFREAKSRLFLPSRLDAPNHVKSAREIRADAHDVLDIQPRGSIRRHKLIRPSGNQRRPMGLSSPTSRNCHNRCPTAEDKADRIGVRIVLASWHTIIKGFA